MGLKPLGLAPLNFSLAVLDFCRHDKGIAQIADRGGKFSVTPFQGS